MPARLSARWENWSDDAVRVHVATPLYPSYSESGIRAELADVACACPMCAGGVTFSGPQAFTQPQSGVAGNGLAIYNWDQAAAQIVRESNGWGAGAVVTFGFRANAPAAMPAGVSGFVPFNAEQIAVAVESLALWSEVANITFVRVQDGTGYTNNATMLFANYTSGADGASAFAYYPGSTSAIALEGDVWINFSLDTNNSNLVEGAFGPHTMAHEIGHAIGLAHPANYDALDGVDPTYPESAVYWQDSRMYTVMSYFGSAGPGGSLGGFASGPQLHDIAAAQLLYGANMSTRTGDTVYGFNSNTGHAHFTITADGQAPVFAIWDAGGNDTIDLSGYSTAVEIDLREEAFSSAGPGNNPAIPDGRAHGNISIARGAVIENGIGGVGADTLIGNAVNNVLTGNAGNDRMTGAGGADTLLGGDGIDTAGYALASTSATWTRNANGTWTVTGEGTDTLTSVEVLDFSNRDVVLDNAQQTFSGDGTSDILWRRTDGLTATWAMSGTAQSGSAVLGSVGNDWSIQGTGDFSGDGRDDILWQRNDGLVYLWNNASIGGAVFVAAASTAWDIQGVGDFNFDGRDDFLWRNPTTGQVAVWTMNGGSVATQAVIGGAGAEWNIQQVADFSGDGSDDILWRRDDGLLAIWNTNGSATTGSSVIGSIGAEWTITGAGDFNGDGYADILWQRNDGLMAIWEMNNTGLLAASVIGGVGTTWHVADVGDYNGDGRDDIFWRNDDGLLAVWTMNGFTVTTTGITGSIGAEWGII